MGSFQQKKESIGSEIESEEEGDDYFVKFERNIQRSGMTIFPDSIEKVIWDLISVFFIFYQSLTLPV